MSRRHIKYRSQERELSLTPLSWHSMLFGINASDAAIVAGKVMWEKEKRYGNHC